MLSEPANDILKERQPVMFSQQTSNGWIWVSVGVALVLIATLVVILVGLGGHRSADEASRPRRGRPTAALAVAAVLALLTLTLGVYVTWSNASGSRARPSCPAPSLPGQVVDVTVADMGGMMGGRMPTWQGGRLVPGTGSGMMGGGGMMGGATSYGRMMSVMVSPTSVPAGDVSFRVWNAGTIVHELVIMPMPPGGPGSRSIGTDGKVSEDGSLGEASNTCGEGAGEGIQPGAASWVTLHLAPGRYELICNIAGHYAMGMYTELDIT
jgi:uncharacterized cupredoxin-like copper-binding protein